MNRKNLIHAAPKDLKEASKLQTYPGTINFSHAESDNWWISVTTGPISIAAKEHSAL